MKANKLLPYLRNFIHHAIPSAEAERRNYEDGLEKALQEYDQALGNLAEMYGIYDQAELMATIQSAREHGLIALYYIHVYKVLAVLNFI